MSDKPVSPRHPLSSAPDFSRRQALRLLGTLIPSALLMPLAGCTWKPEIVHNDPTFTSHDLVDGKLAIMPVKFDNDKAKIQERIRCVQLFWRAVQQTREDIPLVSTATLNDAISGDLDQEAKLLQIYDAKLDDPKAIAPFHDSIPARYLVLSRLNYDQHSVGDGRLVESTLTGNVSILDTTTGRIVWEGKFSSTKSGIDTVMDPSPSKHGLAFFSTFVNGWPAPA